MPTLDELKVKAVKAAALEVHREIGHLESRIRDLYSDAGHHHDAIPRCDECGEPCINCDDGMTEWDLIEEWTWNTKSPESRRAARLLEQVESLREEAREIERNAKMFRVPA